MRKVFVVVFNLLAFCLLAQNEKWYPGVVVTADEEIINGEILFHPAFDLIVVSTGGARNVLPGHRVKSFRFFDESINVNRKFISIDEPKRGAIYEVVLSGEIAVLRKSISASPSSDRDDYRYYFLCDGKLEKLGKFRTVLYPRLRDQLAAEETALRLNPNLDADAICYIELYNRKLSEHTLVAAR